MGVGGGVVVSNAITAMDCDPEITRVWTELDCYITTVVQHDRERVAERANDLADGLLRACTAGSGMRTLPQCCPS